MLDLPPPPHKSVEKSWKVSILDGLVRMLGYTVGCNGGLFDSNSEPPPLKYRYQAAAEEETSGAGPRSEERKLGEGENLEHNMGWRKAR